MKKSTAACDLRALEKALNRLDPLTQREDQFNRLHRIPKIATGRARTSSYRGQYLGPSPIPELAQSPNLEFASGISLDNLLSSTLQMVDQLAQHLQQMGAVGTITSAYRSPEYQKMLRSRWDSGDRVGLVVRPALSSDHSRGEAVDLVTDPRNRLTELGNFAILHGITWGGTWRRSDPVHFSIGRKIGD